MDKGTDMTKPIVALCNFRKSVRKPMKPIPSAVAIRKDEEQVLRIRRATLHFTSLSQESRLVYSVVDCIIVIPDDSHTDRTILCQYQIKDNTELRMTAYVLLHCCKWNFRLTEALNLFVICTNGANQ
jgi:hypothetical protein